MIRTMHGKDFPSAPSRFLHELQLPGSAALVREEAFAEDRPRRVASQPAGFNFGSGTGRPLLMTGADLLNGTTTAIEIPQTFAVGMIVRHPQLGTGSVIEAQGIGKWRTVTVKFTDGEQVSFVVHKCPLQPVAAG
jgi:hypothetical protein